ncbi:unnamed protein product [Phytophthora lilii]|uniref:Unnamed protein product n=1 Tax=Phytophthora lilii TaxID=2077276 RepID=A0A9W6TQX1_9STRA|nr:unnamed protein product [Phytophthora lilii]
MTGYNTRSKYMRRKVNLSSFSSYPSLLQILASTEEMFHEVERDARMAPAVSSIKLNIEPQVTTDAGSAHVLAPVVHIPTGAGSSGAGSSSTPVGAHASLPPKFPSPHLTPSNSSTSAASFPASVLWTSEEQDGVHHEQKFQL